MHLKTETMKTGLNEFTFLWYIENYRYCWHKKGEKLISPKFTPRSLEGTLWELSLYPRGVIDLFEGHILLSIIASKDDDGLRDVGVKCELSVLTTDGSTLASNEKDEETFENRGMILMTDEILPCKRADYLPEDTLIVQCRIWVGEGKVQSLEQIYARTRIGIGQMSFMHVTEEFVSLKPKEKKTIQIKLASREELALSCSLYLSDCSCCDEKILIEIKLNDNNHKLSKCKLFILDKSGNKIECGEIDDRLDYTGKNAQVLPLSLTRQNILSKSSKYLPDGKLFLSCECSFSTGIDYEKIERAVLENPFVGRSHGVLKCVLVAILSCCFVIFASFLWSD